MTSSFAPSGPRAVAVMPVGPGTVEAFARDTIESVLHHGVPGTRMIVVDNSGEGLGARIARHAGVESVSSGGALGPLGGLYVAGSVGFALALEEPFDVLLRIDTDGLVIGSGWEAAAVRLFDSDARLALLGVYRQRYDGQPRGVDGASHYLTRAARLRNYRHDPRRTLAIRRMLRRARVHGYTTGESVLGGICVFHRRGLESLRDAGLLPSPELGRLSVPDDHILSLLLRACGHTFAQFGTIHDELPMAAVWRGLPEAPEALLARPGKALVHSTKSWGDLDEEAVRQVFAAARSQVAADPDVGTRAANARGQYT